MTLTATATIVREDDLTAHIEDTRLFSLFRHGRHVNLTWNELTATEKRQQEAAARAAYVQAFDIY